MEYLPEFAFEKPASAEAAVAAMAANPAARLVAGGTDLLPNMRRGLIETDAVIDISAIDEMRTIVVDDVGLSVGASVRLEELAADETVRRDYSAIGEAAASVAGPTQRAMATVGGNICLDTRCMFYNQSEWWRVSNDYCLKYKGEICHVVPTSKQCYAAYSGDLAAAMLLFDAAVEIADKDGRRSMPLTDLFNDDGEHYLNLPKGALVVALHVPKPGAGARSRYDKIRVRQSIDFPLAGVAVAIAADGTGLRMGLTGTNCRPMLLEIEGDYAGGLSDEEAEAIEKQVQKTVSPVRTTLIQPQYRRRAIAAKAVRAVRDLLGG